MRCRVFVWIVVLNIFCYTMHSILRPVIGHTFSISRQVLKRIKSVEVVNGDVCDSPWLRQAKIHRNPDSSVLLPTKTSPEGDTPTCWTEMEFKRGSTNKGLSFARGLDASIDEIIRPKHAGSSTGSAVASCRAVHRPSECVRHAATNARAANNPITLAHR
jgi:hypothetical protein